MSGIVPSEPEAADQHFLGRPKLRSSMLLSIALATAAIAVQLTVAATTISLCLVSLAAIAAAAALFFWRTEPPKVMATRAGRIKASPPVIH